MNSYSLLLCGILCFKVASSIGSITNEDSPTVLVTPTVNAYVSPDELLNVQPESAASLASGEQLQVVNEGSTFETKRDEQDNSGFIDLGVILDVSDDGLETGTDGRALGRGSNFGYPKNSIVSDGPTKNFDIITGGTFAVDSNEKGRHERDMDIVDNEITNQRFLMKPNEFLSSEGFKNMDEILAAASRMNSSIRQTVEEKQKIRNKRYVSLWDADELVGTETADRFLDLVTAQVIFLLGGRSLEEVTNDRETMKKLMPLLKKLRGTEMTHGKDHNKPAGTKRNREELVEVNGTQDNGTEQDKSVSLDELPRGVEENNTLMVVNDTIKLETHPMNGSLVNRNSVNVGSNEAEHDGVTTPAGGNGSKNEHDKHKEINEETLRKNTDNVSMQNDENVMKVNDPYLFEVKLLTTGNDSIKNTSLYKNFNEAVKDTLRKEILGQNLYHGENARSYGTFEAKWDDLTGESVTKSVAEHVSSGNSNATIIKNFRYKVDKTSVIGDDKHNETSHDIAEEDDSSHQSNDKTHHKGEHTRKGKKHKHLQENQTKTRNEHLQALVNLIGDLKNVVHGSGEGSTHDVVGDSVNATELNIPLDQEPNASVADVSVDNNINEKTENSTVYVKLSDRETNNRNNQQNLGIKEHSERRQHNKKMHKKEKEHHLSHAHQKVGHTDNSLGSLLGEVLKSVSIYEVHGDVGQINIKTDSLDDTFVESGFVAEDLDKSEVRGKTGTVGDGTATTDETFGDADNTNTQNLTRTQESTNDQVIIDSKVQRNNSAEVIDQSKQVSAATPRDSGVSSATRKPYFKLLGYTKAQLTFNSTSNETENKNGTGNSSESQMMLLTNFKNSSNSGAIVHQSKTSSLSESAEDEENSVYYNKMFEDEYDYGAKEVSPKEFKRESSIANDHSLDDSNDDDNDDGGNNAGEESGDKIQSSRDGEHNIDDGNKASDSDDDEDSVDSDDNGDSDEDTENDDHSNSDTEVRKDKVSSDNDSEYSDSDDEEIDDDDDEYNDSESVEEDESSDGIDDNKDSDNDQDDEDNLSSDDDKETVTDGSDEDNSSAYIEVDEESSDDDNNDSDIDKGGDGADNQSNSDIDYAEEGDNETHHNDESHLGNSDGTDIDTNIPRKGRIRHIYRRPINETHLHKGLIRKIHNNALGQNFTNIRKVYKVRRLGENKHNSGKNITDLIQMNQTHSLKHRSDLLGRNGFLVRRNHTFVMGKKKTGHHHGLKIITIHRKSNETNTSNNSTDILTPNNANYDGDNVLEESTSNHTSHESVEAEVGGNQTVGEAVTNTHEHLDQNDLMEQLKNAIANYSKPIENRENYPDSHYNANLEQQNSEKNTTSSSSSSSSSLSIGMKLDNPYNILIYCSTLIILNLFT